MHKNLIKIKNIIFVLLMIVISSCAPRLDKDILDEISSSEDASFSSENIKYNLYDKVIFGKFGKYSLIWTVIDSGDDKVTLYSDYCFDARMSENREYREYYAGGYSQSYYIENYFSEKEYKLIIPDENGQIISLLDSEKYFELFKNEKDRISLGTIDGPYKGSKCYYVGGKSKYKKFTNACDEDGKIYEAYNVLELPNRLVINVKTKGNKNINKIDKNKIQSRIDTNDFLKLEKLDFYKFIDTSIINKRVQHIKNELVYDYEDKVHYFDYNGEEVEIKNFDKNDTRLLKVGDIVYFGKYKNFNKKMIYRVSSKENGEITLESVFSILLAQKYNLKSGYKDSTLREWLNNTFYNEYFSEDEKSLIIKSNISYERITNGKKEDIEDYIYTYSNDDIYFNYFNINIFGNYPIQSSEEIYISTKCYDEEFNYIEDEFVSKNKRIIFANNREISKYEVKYPNSMTVYGVDEDIFNYNGSAGFTYDNEYFGVIPIFKIHTVNEEVFDEVSYPDVKQLMELDKAFFIDNNLYYINKYQELNVIEDYDKEKVLHREDIQVIDHNLSKIYKINNAIYYIRTADYGSKSGTLCKVTNVNNKEIIYTDVYNILKSINENLIEFYVNADIVYNEEKNQYEFTGKIYKYTDNTLYDENGKKIKVDIDAKLKKAITKEEKDKLKNDDPIIIKNNSEYYNPNGKEYYNPDDTFVYYVNDSHDLVRRDYLENIEIIDTAVDNANIYYNAIIYTKNNKKETKTYIYNYDKIIEVGDLPYDYNIRLSKELTFFELRKYTRMKASELIDFEYNSDYRNNVKLYDELKNVLDNYDTNFLISDLYYFDGNNVNLIDNNVTKVYDYDLDKLGLKYRKLKQNINPKANANDILDALRQSGAIKKGEIDKDKTEVFVLYNIYDFLDSSEYIYENGKKESAGIMNVKNKYKYSLEDNQNEDNQNSEKRLSNQIEFAKVVSEYDDDTLVDEFDTVQFGLFYNRDDFMIYDNDYIKWIVLYKDEKNREALLTTKNIIDHIMYSSINENGDRMDWSWSVIRDFLSTVFYDKAFTDEEKEHIIEKEIITKTGLFSEVTTKDKIFILGSEENKKYFNFNYNDDYNKKIATYPTYYATVHGVIDSSHKLSVYNVSKESVDGYLWANNYAGFYIRDTYNGYKNGKITNNVPAYIDYRGKEFTTEEKYGIGLRPCMWVKY